MLSKTILRFFVTFLLALFFLPFVYADDIDLVLFRENYSPFETVQFNVSVNNITLSRDLTFSNLVLLRQDNSQVSLARNLVKVNDNFYVFYFDVPSLAEGNYRLGLSNVAYVKDGISRFGGFFTNLRVVNSSSQILSARPGYVFTPVTMNAEASFTLVLSNKGNDTINVALTANGDFFTLQSTNLILNPGISKNVNVKTSLFGKDNASFSGSIAINYGNKSYLIPFNVIRLVFVQENETDLNVSDSGIVNISYDAISLTTISNRVLSNLSIEVNIGEYFSPGQIVVKNNANVDLYNLSYYLSGNISDLLFVDPIGSDTIRANSSAVFLLGLNEVRESQPGSYSGYLNVMNSQGINYSMPIYLEAYGAIQPVSNINTNLTNISSTTNRSNASVASPPAEEEGDFGVLIIILLVIVVLILVLLYFYKKNKPKQKEFESFVESVKNRRN